MDASDAGPRSSTAYPSDFSSASSASLSSKPAWSEAMRMGGCDGITFLRLTVCALVEQLSRDHDSLDLRRPFVDLRDLGIAEIALDGVVLHVAVAAEQLDRLRRDPHRRLAREELAHRTVERRRAAVVLECGRRVQDRTRGGDA